MTQLSRTAMSLDQDLLEEFDSLIAKRGYANRSEAVRDLIRKALLDEAVTDNSPMVGTLTMVYDHHVPGTADKLIEAQHQAGAMVLANTHVHLDHETCLEVVFLKAKSQQLQALSDSIVSLRGVRLGKLVFAHAASKQS